MLTLCATLIVAAELAPGLGPIVPLTVLACSGIMVLLLREQLFALGVSLWFAAFPVLMLASVLWSTNASLTLYYGFQFFLTVLAAYLIVASVPARRFVIVLFASSAIVCIASYIDGRTAPSTTTFVIVGFVGSKNGIASCANLCLISGLALLFDRNQPGAWRLATLLVAPFAIYIVAVSYAASIVILSVLMPICMLVLFAVSRLPKASRLPVLLIIALLTLTIRVYQDSIQEFVFRTFEKEQTLTGRTYLWKVAEEWIRERPIFGWGYRAQWMGGSVDVIGMLRSQEIPDVKTFSIHQAYLDAWVDAGLIGLIVLSATFAIGTLRAIWNSIYTRSIVEIFSATFLISIVIRSFGESLMGPFYAYATITFALIVYSARQGLLSDAAAGSSYTRRFRLRRSEDVVLSSTG